jgi:hypothetical protein
MRITFGKLVLAPAILAAAALAATAASAETLKVPFSFTAAGKVWPAGEYTVLKDSRGGQVTMRSKDSLHSITFLIGPGEPDPNDRHVTLRFDENGDYHALRDIQYGSKITSRLDKNNRNMEMEEIRSSGR